MHGFHPLGPIMVIVLLAAYRGCNSLNSIIGNDRRRLGMFGVGSAWGKLIEWKTNTSGVFYCMLTLVGKSLYWIFWVYRTDGRYSGDPCAGKWS